MSITVLILFFLCGEASNETGRFRGGGIQRGQGLPWHTILLARSSVLYLLRQGAAKGTCDGAAQGPFGDPGQAGFAGLPPENAGACRQQSPSGRQRLCALGWSEAEEKRAQPSRRRYIKSSRPTSLVYAFPVCRAFAFFHFSFFDASLLLTFCVFREASNDHFFQTATGSFLKKPLPRSASRSQKTYAA